MAHPIIRAHWGMVRTARRGVQSMQVFYVNDKSVGTRVSDVKAKLPDVPLRVLREACNETKTWDEDYTVLQKDGKWVAEKVVYE